MNKLTNNPINDLKGELLKTRNNNFNFDIPTETIKDTSQENNQNISKPKAKEDIRKTKTYRLPQQLINDIEKVVYMDRELRGNETTLVIKALENYVYSKENKELIKQYNELKGSEDNE